MHNFDSNNKFVYTQNEIDGKKELQQFFLILQSHLLKNSNL